VSQGSDVVMFERDNAMRMLMRILGMLEGLAGMLVSRQVILLSLLLGNLVSMGGAIV
jgi:hypothetical protein